MKVDPAINRNHGITVWNLPGTQIVEKNAQFNIQSYGIRYKLRESIFRIFFI